MLLHRLEHDHDEASAIASVHSRRLLEAFGLRDAVWVISDEAQAHECIAILGRRHGDIVSTDGEAGTPGTPSESHPWIVIPVDSKRTKGSTSKQTDEEQGNTKTTTATAKQPYGDHSKKMRNARRTR